MFVNSDVTKVKLMRMMNALVKPSEIKLYAQTSFTTQRKQKIASRLTALWTTIISVQTVESVYKIHVAMELL
jgi:hypothetical protein